MSPDFDLRPRLAAARRHEEEKQLDLALAAYWRMLGEPGADQTEAGQEAARRLQALMAGE